MNIDGLSPALVVSENGTHFNDVARLDAGGATDRIVGIVDPKVAHLVDVAAALHVRAGGLANALTLIVDEIAPPLNDRSVGLEVTSFLASGAIAAALQGFREPFEHWCYQLMEHVLAQIRVPCELRVVHKRDAEPPPLPSGATHEVVLPHCGPEDYLRLSLDSLLQQTQPANISVAIDQAEAGAGFLADIADKTRVEAYQLAPCPVGPYVARHALSLRSRADAVAYQDSDDLSVPHRIASLAEAAVRSGAGIVGSHELQVHQARKKVYAVRYPLDVNASLLRAGANHQLLFPTSLVERDVIDRVGGFSTFRSYSLDVAFWLSASLTTKIINVDEFLYVRRRHPASLTMRPDIGTDSALRREIVACRRADFAAILGGRLSIGESSLAVSHRDSPVMFINLKTGLSALQSCGDGDK